MHNFLITLEIVLLIVSPILLFGWIYLLLELRSLAIKHEEDRNGVE